VIKFFQDAAIKHKIAIVKHDFPTSKVSDFIPLDDIPKKCKNGDVIALFDIHDLKGDVGILYGVIDDSSEVLSTMNLDVIVLRTNPAYTDSAGGTFINGQDVCLDYYTYDSGKKTPEFLGAVRIG
jgi:hypothetical protein